MLNELKLETNKTTTENGAPSLRTTGSDCLDFFATVGALRNASEDEILSRFLRAYAEDSSVALRILFFARDVRGGLGERRVFRILLRWLAAYEPQALLRVLPLVSEYGRYDDVLILLGTTCEEAVLALIARQLATDTANAAAGEPISLLAKWLPSVNTSCAQTRALAKQLAKKLGMQECEYRLLLSRLRKHLAIVENNLREQDYSFDYEKLPSKALFRYRQAFLRNDKERYDSFLTRVSAGEAVMHTQTLMPYEVIAPCMETAANGWRPPRLNAEQRRAVEVSWRALEDFGGEENALVVVDGSGSMYSSKNPCPAAVAFSLGIYFAERNRGRFRDHFITFSEHPQLIQIKGQDIYEKVRYVSSFCEVANTDLSKVFELILKTAMHNDLPQSELPAKLYIITDMEFDRCAKNAEQTNFDHAKQLFRQYGYRLPEVVFWNVESRNTQQPVRQNEQGVALVSGCTPRLFSQLAGGLTSPYAFMMEVLNSERYANIR